MRRRAGDVGWLVVGLLVALALAAGLGWLAARERRLRGDAEAQALLLGQRLATCIHSLEARDAELASARAALVAAQQVARTAAHREAVAALPDQEIGAALAAALAARRLPRYGRDGGGSDLATCDTSPDLRGLAARESGLPAGAALPGGSGGPGGARGLGPG